MLFSWWEDEDDDNEEYQSHDDAVNLAVAERENAAERKKWDAIRQAQVERSSDHEAFFSEVEQSSMGDGFSTVAAYFGKALIM